MNLVTFLVLAQLAAVPPCMPHDDMVRFLERAKQETPEGIGLNGDDQIVELFTSPDRTTWTIVISEPNGRSCAVTSGEDWKFLNLTGGERA